MEVNMAVYPVQPGHPDYSSTGSSKYIPAVYAALLVKKFYPKSCFAKISNTDYEGEIKEQGDTVNIRTRPTIETFRYKKGMVLPVQNPESPSFTLVIDQGDGFSFAIDRVDEFQSDIDLMDEWADDASEQMVQVIDRNVLIGLAASGALAEGNAKTTIEDYDAEGLQFSNYTLANGAIVNGNTTVKGSTIALGQSDAAESANTGDKITALILKYGRYLDENNAPEAGRFVILPTWCGEILKSMANNNFGLAYATGQNTANLLSGSVPNIDRFDIMFSNNLPASTEVATDVSAVLFGCKYATTFATQITENRTIDNPFSFGKMMQGLQVYGGQSVKPNQLGVDFLKNAA
jgi:hypothetical protein